MWTIRKVYFPGPIVGCCLQGRTLAPGLARIQIWLPSSGGLWPWDILVLSHDPEVAMKPHRERHNRRQQAGSNTVLRADTVAAADSIGLADARRCS